MLGIVGSLLGSVASGVLGMFGQNSANQQNMAMQQEQERYGTQMSNSAFTRASADMTNAGLNPSAMFGSGGPASTPGISAPMMGNPMASMSSSIGSAVSSATQQAVAQKTIDNLVTQNANILTDSKLKEAQTSNTLAQVGANQAGSTLAVRRADAIGKMPDSIYTPVVQAGFSADSTKNMDNPVGLISGAAGSAKSVYDSFTGVASDIGRQLRESSPGDYVPAPLRDWWNSDAPSSAITARGNRNFRAGVVVPDTNASKVYESMWPSHGGSVQYKQ